MILHPSHPGRRPNGPRLPGEGQARERKSPRARFVTVGVALCAAFAVTPAVQALEGSEQPSVMVAKSVPHARARHSRENTYLKRKWGVEPMYVRQTAGGYMLEFRYKVLDAEKAKPLFERRTKPILTDAKTGLKLVVPAPAKTGALRNSNPPIEGRIYWMFFGNAGKLVKPGQYVSIDIGKFHVDRLLVQ